MSDFDSACIRLKTARIAAGFKSAKSFCDRYHIPASTYSLHETGGRSISPKLAQKYADILGVTFNWLITGTASAYSEPLLSNSKPISHEKFMELLKYNGNTHTDEAFNVGLDKTKNINPLVFSKILIGIMNALHEFKIYLDDEHATKKAIEIYDDIEKASNKSEEQIIMVGLSITVFKRQMNNIMKSD
jgi:transcriptional regulator with XRE-family HTH domain